MKYYTQARTRGFTIVELLVVITIIVLLTGIILKNLSGSRGKARDAQRVSDLAQLQLALALFMDRCGEYPTGATLATTMTSTKCPSGVTLGTYIAQIPVPPAGASQAAYDYTYYRITSTGLRVNYVLHAKLESPNAAVAKGLAASSISDPSSSQNTAPNGWSQAANSPPYSNCSNALTSVDYCVGPN
ncbi:MAG: gspG [Candidatus Parcubacteria bacterium]|nr:gspG [Candidatus Parcubacteria bacterium]